MASQSTIGFRRRQTRTGVVYEIDKGAREVAFRLVLMVVGWLVGFIVCLAVWLGVWQWLGGENAADPRVARVACWIGLAAGIVAAIPVLLLFRWLWRRIGASFSLSQQGVTKSGRLIPWGELENLRVIDSTSGMDYLREGAGGYGMGREHSMALAVTPAASGCCLRSRSTWCARNGSTAASRPMWRGCGGDFFDVRGWIPASALHRRGHFDAVLAASGITVDGCSTTSMSWVSWRKSSIAAGRPNR